MTQPEIEQFVLSLENVERDEAMGYLFFFVGADHMIPFVSIAQTDNAYDTVSQLDRDGVFRVNIGVSKETVQSLFPDSDAQSTIDYTALNVFMPHPEYAKQFFVCILNPSQENEGLTKKLILEAHSIAVKRREKKSDGS